MKMSEFSKTQQSKKCFLSLRQNLQLSRYRAECAKIALLIFRRQPGRQVELQKGLDRFWLSGIPSSPPRSVSSSCIYCLCKHFSATPTHFYPKEAHSAPSIIMSGLCLSKAVCRSTVCGWWRWGFIVNDKGMWCFSAMHTLVSCVKDIAVGCNGTSAWPCVIIVVISRSFL